MADETTVDGDSAAGAAPRRPVGPRGGGPQFKGGIPWEGGTPEGLSPTAPAWSTHAALPPSGYGVAPRSDDGGGLAGAPSTTFGGHVAPAPASIAAMYGLGAAREHPEATKVLVLGVLGIFVCGLVAPWAWISGNSVMRQIDSAPALYTNRGIALAGRILGIIGTVLMVASVPLMVLWFASFAYSPGY